MDERHFCHHCRDFVDVIVRQKTEVYKICEEPITVTSNVCYCTSCGDAVWDNILDSDNLLRVYDEFMKRHNLKDIDELREYVRHNQ